VRVVGCCDHATTKNSSFAWGRGGRRGIQRGACSSVLLDNAGGNSASRAAAAAAARAAGAARPPSLPPKRRRPPKRPHVGVCVDLDHLGPAVGLDRIHRGLLGGGFRGLGGGWAPDAWVGGGAVQGDGGKRAAATCGTGHTRPAFPGPCGRTLFFPTVARRSL
jgi:hypothetical protein